MSFFVPINLVPLTKNMEISFSTYYGTFQYSYDISAPFIHWLLELKISRTEKVHESTFSGPFGYNWPYSVPFWDILGTYSVMYPFGDLFGTSSFYSVHKKIAYLACPSDIYHSGSIGHQQRNVDIQPTSYTKSYCEDKKSWYFAP